jgi:hypothetical protein
LENVGTEVEIDKSPRNIGAEYKKFQPKQGYVMKL